MYSDCSFGIFKFFLSELEYANLTQRVGLEQSGSYHQIIENKLLAMI
jgi:hypothetical protein